MSVAEKSIISNTIRVVNYFGIESYDNYLYDNEAYNWCSNILCNSTIYSPIKKDNYREVSFPELKKDVYLKAGFILENVDLIVDHMSWEEFDEDYKVDVSVLENKKKSINVFEVPIYDHIFNEIGYLIDAEQESMPILIESIYLNKSKDILNMGCSYIHEIGHALYQRKKKCVRNYLHLEFIPITLELLYAYANGGEEGLYTHTIDYISHYQKKLSQPLNIIDHQYGISQLLGYQALEKYIEFRPQQKEEMISRLKDCLNCSIQAETFMEDYDIGFQDKDSSIKYFRKTMERVGIR